MENSWARSQETGEDEKRATTMIHLRYSMPRHWNKKKGKTILFLSWRRKGRGWGFERFRKIFLPSLGERKKVMQCTIERKNSYKESA